VQLFSHLQYSGSSSSDPDGDVFTSTWKLTQSDCTSDGQVPCSQAPNDFCFLADKPGDCTLTLTVKDGDGMTGTAMIHVHANDDAPPCIAETDPFIVDDGVQQIARNPDDDVPLNVTRLLDDGDPLPPPPDRPSMASFIWSYRVGTSGPFLRLTDPRQQSYSLPKNTFQLGDTVEVRVEAHDRVDRLGELDSCLNASDPPLVCNPTGSCKRWVTWKVEMVL
jgi:hypothetical protein